jgi:hypothetical protein
LVNKNEYDWDDFSVSCFGETKSIFLGVERGVTTHSMNFDPAEFIKLFRNPKCSSIFRNDTDAEILSEVVSDYLKKKQSNKEKLFKN